MCRQRKLLVGEVVCGALALWVALLALFPAGAAAAGAAAGAPGLNGPGELQVGRLALGHLTAGSSASCIVAYTLQVQTEIGQGSDSFELQLYDDGALIQTQALSAPADGAVHALAASIQLQHPISQASPGIGVYLVDSGAILDFVDPVDVSCGFVEIPTLDSAGIWLLGGLLLASALVVLRRPRRVL